MSLAEGETDILLLQPPSQPVLGTHHLVILQSLKGNMCHNVSKKEGAENKHLQIELCTILNIPLSFHHLLL